MIDSSFTAQYRRRNASTPGVVLAALWLAAPTGISAHSEVRPTPDTLWSVWEPDPLIAIALLVFSCLYLRGTAELWRRAGTGRGVRRWQVWSFFGGVTTFAVAKLSPLDALGGALFSAHMVQHLIVFLISPLLFAASRPLLPMLWALPASWRRGLSRWWKARRVLNATWQAVNHWVGVLLLYAGVLWLWHVPALYDAALESQVVHAVEHLSFAIVAFMFWTSVLDAGRPEGIGHAPALLLTFATALHSSALGALLTFASKPIYASHEPYTDAWSLTPLEDQQLAGVIMWVPMGIWFTITALILFGLWIRAADRSVRRLEAEGATLHTFRQPRNGAAPLLPDQSAAPGRN